MIAQCGGPFSVFLFWEVFDMMIYILAFVTLVKALLTKKYRFIPLCICSVLYEIALGTYVYPQHFTERYLLISAWFEHVLFVFLIVSIFFASIRKDGSSIIIMKLPRILAIIATVVRIVRQIFGRMVLADKYLATATTEEILSTMKTSSLISNAMLGAVNLIFTIIMIYYMVKVYKEESSGEEDVVTDCHGHEMPSQ